jgi:PAS domain-containing protein
MIARSLMPAAIILPVVNTILSRVFAHFQVYDSSGKVAVLSINILTAITILWIGTSKVLGIDLLRRKAEDRLRASYDDLDRRVQLRTQELVDAKHELLHTNAMLGSLIEACPLAIIAFNLDGSVRNWNAAAEAMRLDENPECRELANRASRDEPVANAELTDEVHGVDNDDPLCTNDPQRGVNCVGLLILHGDNERNTPFGVELSGQGHVESINRHGVHGAATGIVQFSVVHPVIINQVHSPVAQHQDCGSGLRHLGPLS